jgi:hypothetical protein
MGAAGNSGRFAPWASGWLTWGTESDNTNVLFIRNERWARLAPYIDTPDNVHKCPSDPYLSRPQQSRGWKQRIRSVVMNGTLGHANFPGNAGPWDQTYAVAKTISELNYPGPAETSVFLEEHPDSMNDPFLFPPQRTSWIDFPGGFHNGAGAFSFGDGHIEMHPWRGPSRAHPVTYNFRPPPARVGDPDISWMSYHSQRRNAMSH